MEFSGGLAAKDLAFSQLWLEFYPWPGNFCLLQVRSKKKRKRKKEAKKKKKKKKKKKRKRKNEAKKKKK